MIIAMTLVLSGLCGAAPRSASVASADFPAMRSFALPGSAYRGAFPNDLFWHLVSMANCQSESENPDARRAAILIDHAARMDRDLLGVALHSAGVSPSEAFNLRRENDFSLRREKLFDKIAVGIANPETQRRIAAAIARSVERARLTRAGSFAYAASAYHDLAEANALADLVDGSMDREQLKQDVFFAQEDLVSRSYGLRSRLAGGGHSLEAGKRFILQAVGGAKLGMGSSSRREQRRAAYNLEILTFPLGTKAQIDAINAIVEAGQNSTSLLHAARLFAAAVRIARRASIYEVRRVTLEALRDQIYERPWLKRELIRYFSRQLPVTIVAAEFVAFPRSVERLMRRLVPDIGPL